MASSFNRWEKDPFFSAAEEVQESADRMESTYRTWIHAKKDADAASNWDFEGLRRDLQTAIGTTKWQLEEFERAVNLSYGKSSGNDNARDRHCEFINAMEDHILRVENSLKEGNLLEGETALPWVRLNEGERDELELFLSAPSVSGNNQAKTNQIRDDKSFEQFGKEPILDCLKNSQKYVEAMEGKSHGHRRTASASADIGAWKISIAMDGQQPYSSNVPAPLPPRKVPSFSGFLSSMESVPKFSWPKNGIRKWKVVDRHQESDTIPLRSSQLAEGINACFEKTKDCLDNSDECYNKRLHSWYGAMHRQLQRSQYQMQYNRPAQLAIWLLLFFLCLVVVIVLRAW